MKREIRIILATIVLLVGLITAALFRPPAQSAPEEDGAGVALLTAPSYTQHMQTVSYAKTSPVPKATPIEMPRPKVDVPALPTPTSILPTPATSHSAKAKSAPSVSRTAEDDVVPELPVSFPSPKKPLQPEPKKRIHTIVDGDTLRGLASRYLDNESRWSEIYQVNRHALEDPVTLPIGAKLTIPPRTPYPNAKHASKSRVFSASNERLTSRPVSHQPQPPVARQAAKPIEKTLKVLPSEPMVPMTP